jgi:hypothetical protein
VSSDWYSLLIRHLIELASLRREHAEVQKAILGARAEVSQAGSDHKWRQDSAVLVHTRELREEEVDVATSIQLHEAAVDTIRLFIEIGLGYDQALEPPPRLD